MPVLYTDWRFRNIFKCWKKFTNEFIQTKHGKKNAVALTLPAHNNFEWQLWQLQT